MRVPAKSIQLSLMLLATVVLAQVCFMLTGSTSIGVFITSAFYFILFLALSAVRRQQSLSVVSTVVLLALIFAHGAVNCLIYDAFDYERFLASYILLIAFFLGAISFVLLVQKVTQPSADFSIRLVFYVLLVSSVAGILKFSLFTSGEIRKPVLFFNEPSSYSLGFAPFLLYMAVMSSPKVRFLLVSISYSIALALESFTLVIATSLVVLLILPLRYYFFLVPALVIVFLAWSVNVSYYSSRADFSEDNTNLSSLVYVSGWERAYLSLKDTFGLGLGFQQFGVIGQQGQAMEVLDGLGATDLNRLNGGAIAPKFIGEFGIVAVVMLFVYTFYFVKYFKWLRSICLGKVSCPDNKKYFFISCFLMFSLDLFVRGSGYFAAEGFMLLASLVSILLSDSLGRHSDGARNLVEKSCP
jgi:hypothetical protein